MSIVGPATPWLLLAASVLLLLATLHAGRRESGSSNAQDDTRLTDPLTGIAGHRAFQERLAHECERAYRFVDSFALIFVDVDHFQKVNNKFGHGTGDRILQELTTHFRKSVREIDLCARFGGDQFALILPHTIPAGALEVGERLREETAAATFATPKGSDLRLTLSAGIAFYPEDGGTPPELVSTAQRSTTFAKSLGGNQVQLFSELPPADKTDSGMTSLSGASKGAIVQSLAAAVDVRDRYTHSHSRSVSDISVATARKLGIDGHEIGRIKVGALLHDVGKIGIPDAILTKEGPLTQEEWGIIQQHPTLEKTIIEQTPELQGLVPLVLHHQECFNGSGYPDGAKGERIPLGARIIAAADAYHAIRSDRPYRDSRGHSDAIREILRCSGTQFDPQGSGRWPASRISTKVCATWLSPLSLQPTANRTQDPPRCPQQWAFAVSKNAGAGTRTRTGVTLRFLRPLRLPFRHSGPQTRSLVSYSTSPATRPSRISRSETSKSRDPGTFIAVRSISPPATITSSLPSCMQGSPRRSRQVMDASRPTWLWISSRVRRAW